MRQGFIPPQVGLGAPLTPIAEHVPSGVATSSSSAPTSSVSPCLRPSALDATTHRTHVRQRDEDPSDDANRPHKHQKILRFSEHEDDSHQTFFEDAEIDDLERYDYGLNDEERADDLQPEASMTDADVFKRLTVPSTMLEPSLTAVELLELDVIADAVEIERLKKMNVLFPAKTFEFNGESPKRLTARMVRPWRDRRIQGQHAWLRRSRLLRASLRGSRQIVKTCFLLQVRFSQLVFYQLCV